MDVARVSFSSAEIAQADLASIAATEGRAFVLLGDRDTAVARLRDALACEPWLRANAEAAQDAAGLLQNLLGSGGAAGSSRGGAGGQAAAGGSAGGGGRR